MRKWGGQWIDHDLGAMACTLGLRPLAGHWGFGPLYLAEYTFVSSFVCGTLAGLWRDPGGFGSLVFDCIYIRFFSCVGESRGPLAGHWGFGRFVFG